MHLIHTSQAPSYLTDIVTQTASVTSRTRLQSGSSLRYEQPRTRLKFGQRAFSYTAPAVWNSLPPSLQELSDTASFKRNFKTLLFQRAFYLWVVFTFCTLSFYPRGIYHEVSKQTGLHLSFFYVHCILKYTVKFVFHCCSFQWQWSFLANLHRLMTVCNLIFTAGRKTKIWQRNDKIFAVSWSLLEYEAE